MGWTDFESLEDEHRGSVAAAGNSSFRECVRHLSLMFALAVPFIEHGWSLRQSGGLLLFAWTLGLLLAGPIVLFGGMLAGATLYLFRRSVIGE